MSRQEVFRDESGDFRNPNARDTRLPDRRSVMSADIPSRRMSGGGGPSRRMSGGGGPSRRMSADDGYGRRMESFRRPGELRDSDHARHSQSARRLGEPPPNYRPSGSPRRVMDSEEYRRGDSGRRLMESDNYRRAQSSRRLDTDNYGRSGSGRRLMEQDSYHRSASSRRLNDSDHFRRGDSGRPRLTDSNQYHRTDSGRRIDPRRSQSERRLNSSDHDYRKKGPLEPLQSIGEKADDKRKRPPASDRRDTRTSQRRSSATGAKPTPPGPPPRVQQQQQQHPVPVQQQYPVQGHQYAVPGQRYPVQSQQYPAQAQHYPVQAQRYPAQAQQYPHQTQQYPIQTKKHPVQVQQHAVPVQTPAKIPAPPVAAPPVAPNAGAKVPKSAAKTPSLPSSKGVPAQITTGRYRDDPNADHPEYGGDTGYKRKHKYTTDNLPVISPYKKWCMMIIFVAVALGAMYGVSFVTNYIFFSDELRPDDNATDAENAFPYANKDNPNKVLKRNKQFITALCAPDKMIGANRKYCEDACALYDGCCNVFDFTEQNTTCYFNNVDGCYSYAKCHALDSFIPGAPESIERACHEAAIAIDSTECEKICEPVKCCWSDPQVEIDIEPCLDTRYATCQDYSYCQNLRWIKYAKAKGTRRQILPVAPSNLDKECEDNTAICRRYCSEEISCCQQPFSDCYRDNFISCLSYIPCNNRIIINSNNENQDDDNIQIAVAPDLYRKSVPRPATNLHRVCSSEGIAKDPFQCDRVCEKARCCWEGGRENCFGSDPLGCLTYMPCFALPADLLLSSGGEGLLADESNSEYEYSGADDVTNTGNGQVGIKFSGLVDRKRFPKNRVYMNNLCGANSIAEYSGYEDCHEQCQSTNDCCNPFQMSNSTCFSQQIVGCYNYARCHHLDGIFPPAPHQLGYVCSKDEIASNRTACEMLCDPVRCCWDDTWSPCIGSNFLACQDYAMCQNLRYGPIIQIAPRGLDIECAEGTDHCTKVCASTLSCCSNPFSACYRENFIPCISYMVCPSFTAVTLPAQIHSELAAPPTKPKDDEAVEISSYIDMSQVCSPEYIIRNGAEECESVCEVASCCFQSGKSNCFGNDPLACLEYLSCRVLHKQEMKDIITMNNVSFVESRVKVQRTCSFEKLLTSQGVQRCQKICEPYLSGCCDPYRMYKWSSVETINLNDPNEIDGSVSEVVEKETDTIQNNADENDIYSTVNISASCFYHQMTGCYNYARCHALDKKALAAPNDLDLRCSFEYLNNKGTDECVNLCNQQRCCWDPSIKSCMQTRFMTCLDYSHCQNLKYYLKPPEIIDGDGEEDEGDDFFNDDDGTPKTTTPPSKNATDDYTIALPVAIDELDTTCLAQESQECLSTCSKAATCCNDMYSDCFRSDMIACISYATCAKHHDFVTSLNDIPFVNSIIPPAPKDTYSVCNEQYFEAYGNDECLETCKHAACCFFQDDDQAFVNPFVNNSTNKTLMNLEYVELTNCYGDDPLGCFEYIPCKILFE